MKFKYPFTPEMDELLTKLYPCTSNADITKLTGWTEYMMCYAAKRLGLKKDKEYTRTAGRLAGLGWSPEQEQYLVDNFRCIGDADLADKLNELLPRPKPFRANNIKAKRKRLKLIRTEAENKAITSSNGKVGGRAFTIIENSGATKMSDGWVANTITRDKDLANELKNHPEIIDLKRQQIMLKRLIRNIN